MAWARFRRFASFWLYPMLAVLLGRAAGGSSLARNAWLILVGVAFWSLLEYAMHRFLFHWEPAHPALRAFLARLHKVHHTRPRDPDRILARPLATLPVSAALLLLFYGLSGFGAAVSLMIGVWTGFLYYEWVHYRVHTSASDLAGLRGQRARHFRHHFVDEGAGFGVTSGFWDRVFGTRG